MTNGSDLSLWLYNIIQPPLKEYKYYKYLTIYIPLITYPPRLVLCGATTVIHTVAAIAASIALPPFLNILVPICEQLV